MPASHFLSFEKISQPHTICICHVCVFSLLLLVRRTQHLIVTVVCQKVRQSSLSSLSLTLLARSPLRSTYGTRDPISPPIRPGRSRRWLHFPLTHTHPYIPKGSIVYPRGCVNIAIETCNLSALLGNTRKHPLACCSTYHGGIWLEHPSLRPKRRGWRGGYTRNIFGARS